MKIVYIVGAGMNAQNITQEGMNAIAASEILFGAPRLLEAFTHLDKPSFPTYKPDDVLAEIKRSEKSIFTVLVSGDVGFFSGATSLCDTLKGFDIDIVLVPGVSCVNAFSAKLGIPWQDFKLVSMHGINTNIVEHVRRNLHVLCLTGDNAAEVGQRLDVCGFGGVKIHAGENLGYKNEKITQMTARDLSETKLASLTVLLIVNDNFDNRVRFGLSDDEFARLDGIPMTKSEVRAVVSAKLGLSPDAVCYDIGAGTGSVTVEMALAAYDGQVYAIERNEKALPLIRENLRRFHVGNVTVVHGKAPDVFEELPPPDAAFIGGSSGEIDGIIDTLVRKNPKVRIVITAIALESVAAALASLEKAFVNVELLQIGVSRSKSVGNLHMMTAQNPVTILSGGGI